mmetsp:Transcript_13127/g.43829  ORF Transcript_13127/g.43829 Transcript_13127/m.43829 type:complete len:212 (+) Transcript_13127:328-963(+)
MGNVPRLIMLFHGDVQDAAGTIERFLESDIPDVCLDHACEMIPAHQPSSSMLAQRLLAFADPKTSGPRLRAGRHRVSQRRQRPPPEKVKAENDPSTKPRRLVVSEKRRRLASGDALVRHEHGVVDAFEFGIRASADCGRHDRTRGSAGNDAREGARVDQRRHHPEVVRAESRASREKQRRPAVCVPALVEERESGVQGHGLVVCFGHKGQS